MGANGGVAALLRFCTVANADCLSSKINRSGNSGRILIVWKGGDFRVQPFELWTPMPMFWGRRRLDGLSGESINQNCGGVSRSGKFGGGVKFVLFTFCPESPEPKIRAGSNDDTTKVLNVGTQKDNLLVEAP